MNFEDTNYFRYVTILNKYGVNILDVTPYVDKNRELEIKAYLSDHPEVDNFLIFDNDYVIKDLLEYEIFLDLYNGICDYHIEPAINILNGNLGFYPPNFNFNETYEERVIRINKFHSLKK